jgi:hypothetical protein
MATRSTIAVLHKDGTVSQIYCHWDGYVSHNGRILQEHYNSLDLAEELVELGNLSSLGKELWPQGDHHSFDDPETGVCVFYCRDRAETNQAPVKFRSLDMYFLEGDQEEYNYLFDSNDDEWKIHIEQQGVLGLEKHRLNPFVV